MTFHAELVQDKEYGVNYRYITESSDVERLNKLLLEDRRAKAADSEATGVTPYIDKTMLFQVGDRDTQYVIDTRVAKLDPLQQWLESRDHKKVFHNGPFDYVMTKSSLGFEIEGIRCTYLMERILTAGREFDESGKIRLGLGPVVFKRLGKIIDKEMQKSFIGHPYDKPFSKRQLAYAAGDVVDPVDVFIHQSNEAARLGLIDTCVLECNAIQAFGDMRLNGMKLNKELWQKTVEENKAMSAEAKKKMDKFAEHYVGKNLFGDININYDSPSQILDLLQSMNIMVKERDPKSNSFVDRLISNTNKQTQKKIKHLPFIQALTEYRRFTTLVNMFGENFYDAINPVTGRIHQDLFQIGTDTGRPSAGSENDGADDLFAKAKGKKKALQEGEVGTINPLNIPAKPQYRNSFVSEGPDYVIETDDYNGCEMRILAEISHDPKLIYIFDNGLCAHCYVATELYGVEVTKTNENKHHRKPAKALNFGIAYGMGPGKLCDDLNADGIPITFQEAKNNHSKYCYRIFPTAVGYLRDSGRLAFRQGWLSNLNGRRRWWGVPNPENKETFPRGDRDFLFKAIKGSIEREGGNFKIQSVNADMTKKAMTDIRDHIKANNVRSNLYNAVYDEIVTETHKDDSPDFQPIKQKIMIEAAAKWLKRVPMLVDGTALPHWTKD